MSCTCNQRDLDTGNTEGIQGNIAQPDTEPNNYVTIYVQVDDIAVSLKQVEALGGKTLVPATEVSGMGNFAWFADLDGNAIGPRSYRHCTRRKSTNWHG